MTNKIELLKQNLFNVLVLLVIILGVPVLLINGGFFYADTEKVVNIQILESDPTDSDFRLFDEIASIDNVSRIDRDSLLVDVSRRTVSSINEDISEIEIPDGVNISVTEIYPGITSIQLIGNILLAGVLFTSALFIGAFYVIYRKSLPRGGYSDLAITMIIYGASVTLSAFVQISLLAIFSRIYQIRQLDVITILITTIWSALMFIMVYLTLRTTHRHTISDLVTRITEQNRHIQKRLVIPALLMIVPLYFGLGVKFVIPGILLYASFVMPIFVSDLVVNGYNYISGIKLSKSSDLKDLEDTKKTTTKNSKSVVKNKKKKRSRRR